MEIRLLNESDAHSYQQVRLSALKNNPEAFGSTYEQEVAYPLEVVGDRLKPGQDQFVLGAFQEDGSLAGIVTFKREESPKMRHRGNVFAMYVAPEARGRSVGKSLLEELIRRAREGDGLEQIHLAVVAHNAPARRLYTSLGFEVYGTEPNALKVSGKYYDEDLMILRW
ncbi:acetyltransferase [Bhargavaea cecembensis]|uniref:Acetyltransferase n=1 Tax=Bhargavaea cecembensis TaxID=394098 RepID=A0A161SQJ2_9BACL|nr:GNAT family N-acetyltransferase [Bhargavaea cecembensis]KZE37500.1 acetyltransferase [Bhargavaea cecembensis]